MADYITGFFCKKPSEKAPQFIKAKVSIKKTDFINWLHTQETEWVNIDVLESQKGEFYGKVDDWKPNTQGEQKDSTTSQNSPNKTTPQGGYEAITSEEQIPYPDNQEIDPNDVPF